MTDQNIVALLTDYVRYAEQVATELRVEFGQNNLLSAVNSGSIPRNGVCKSFGGGSYFFHGVGCRIEAAEIEIDFDFGPLGSIPGADSWKLFDFADAHREAYPWLPMRSMFDQRIQQLSERGVLRKINVPPSPNLVCLEQF